MATASTAFARPRSAPRRPRDLKPTDPAVGRLAGLGRAATVTLVPARKVVVCANTTNPVAAPHRRVAIRLGAQTAALVRSGIVGPRRHVAPRARRRRQRSQRVQRRASRGARAVAREVALRAARGTPPNRAVPPRCPAAPHSFDRLHHVARRVAHGPSRLLEPLRDGVGVGCLELGEQTH
jgi:hypothetical protein